MVHLHFLFSVIITLQGQENFKESFRLHPCDLAKMSLSQKKTFESALKRKRLECDNFLNLSPKDPLNTSCLPDNSRYEQ